MSSDSSSLSGKAHLLHRSDEGPRHAPTTTTSHDTQVPEAIPTVSATGMPRLVPRHADERPDSAQERKDSELGSAPPEFGSTADNGEGEPDESESEKDDQLYSEDLDESGDEQGSTSAPQYPPSGSLTLAALSPYSSIPISRRLVLITSSLLVNLGLPFLNGVMLGFGEIFARVILAPALGITGVGWNGNTDSARVQNAFATRRSGQVDAMTAGGAPNRGAWSQGSSGTVEDDVAERREQIGEEMYL